ncbi:type II toxin-antitoxin system RelE/ParE family toxin [Lewinella sp. JB7]|uniref:type II toxin-antitoxin system RelE/ParE family toxin n=1 Tax=Lewinella sp. JB7 TaxID=2962887 RepID=UPI0020C94F3F|nr:type II toxin-antitoxin system RelE/ParE family toxin [Lewinella sp. JB7]MCP9237904.1 type II toxin-antitoxin system RelE/ParE family toxin [Lewinella sp. JB7]
MADYKLSGQAEIDIAEMYESGIEMFGLSQAQDYMLQLHDLFETLADGPELGRDASRYAPNLLRLNFKAHAVFYLPIEAGILIVRVLGQRMDLEQQF